MAQNLTLSAADVAASTPARSRLYLFCMVIRITFIKYSKDRS